MEKLALCSREFWDKEILDKCIELNEKNDKIKELTSRIKELETGSNKLKVLLSDYSDYSNKLSILHETLFDVSWGTRLVTEVGISTENEMFIRDNIEIMLVELTSADKWSRLHADSISRNITSLINNLLEGEDGFPEVFSNPNTAFAFGLNAEGWWNQIIFNHIHDVFWDQRQSRGILDDWENGAVFVIKCKLCEREITPCFADTCEGCLYHSSFS